MSDIPKQTLQEASDRVQHVKQLRKDLDAIIQLVRTGIGSRERSLVLTKLQEATMWLGMELKAIGEAHPGLLSNPYPTSKDPGVTTIEPTADNLKL